MPVALIGPFREGIDQPAEAEFTDEVIEQPENEEDAPFGGVAARRSGERTVERSVALTSSWPLATRKSGGVDPQMAVSNDVVAVLTWGTLGYYDKSGALLPKTPTFANPTKMSALLKSAVADIDLQLNLDPAYAGNPDFSMAKGEVGDARITFDLQRHRWVIVATAKNNNANNKNLYPSSVIAAVRRTKLILAVSHDEDPRHGFAVYWTNGTPDDGACSSLDNSACAGSDFVPGNAGDYPSIGTSPSTYVMSVHVGHVDFDSGDPTFNAGYPGHPVTSYVVAVGAEEVTSGGAAWAHAFYGFEEPNGDPAVDVLMPALQADASLGDLALLVGTSRSDELDLYYVLPNLAFPSQPMLVSASAVLGSSFTPPGDGPQPGTLASIKDSNMSNTPVSAFVRGGVLLTAINDCILWRNSSICTPTLRVLVIDPGSAGPTVQLERFIGNRNVFDDAATDVVSHAWPAVAMNQDGDVAVSYLRSSPQVFLEARYSTWLHGQSGFGQSGLLQAGKVSIGTTPMNRRQIDTSAIALDAYDSTGIWVAQFYADNNGGKLKNQPIPRLAVGKVFGIARPDLQVSSVSFVGGPGRGQMTVSFRVRNGGDGPAPAGGTAVVKLNGGAFWLGQLQLPAIAVGQSFYGSAVVDVPPSVPAGSYEVDLDAFATVPEYTLNNNRGVAPLPLLR